MEAQVTLLNRNFRDMFITQTFFMFWISWASHGYWNIFNENTAIIILKWLNMWMSCLAWSSFLNVSNKPVAWKQQVSTKSHLEITFCTDPFHVKQKSRHSEFYFTSQQWNNPLVSALVQGFSVGNAPQASSLQWIKGPCMGNVNSSVVMYM